ncbi:hypothetical protein Lxx12990 [Leifsonia xyli subsp. xyli str. CTCB07]|uniref:Uncharacterized protein n=2 Tax=Leifsonia xyli subsp. xyli TaxID=59736 RepID=Q6AEQ9_LEIXX|nr:hypothetical protein Lxx12990 [Leifsonia xyli subsp. xyli str. CTCB07]
MTFSHFLIGDLESRTPFWVAFTIFFYLGVLLLASGFFLVFTRRALKRLDPLWRLRSAQMTLIVGRAEGNTVDVGLIAALRSAEPVVDTYNSIVRIRDLEVFNDLTLTPRGAATVERIEGAFARKLGQDRIDSAAGNDRDPNESFSSQQDKEIR